MSFFFLIKYFIIGLINYVEITTADKNITKEKKKYKDIF